ncbi:MAG: Asp-tRNA(Asn)/Glu-tRNA(Gln) amidotransferase subunit GatB [Nanoarchaeota archaeon]|nr:Asp-tRNA(Asn)/Glu-tRNA(Gln) amidotransferase subunit GatB [Nanoarchaeota archaeon]MBU4124050.1 Asp-tRNA(Asn)/Glu-tRNA(Gln) amidotransferase subunit GatB [Nanoarchaeota archaeon]
MVKNIKIGLETHVQLNTNTKLFCSCSMKNISEAPENTRCCPICLGMPGSKPSLNKAVLDLAIKIGLALDCKISPETFFSRKTYLYPDMSKNFQITQYEIPIAKKGKLEITDRNGKRKEINIERINIEEDPAKLHHVDGDISSAKYTLINYNRSGIPLCEIVTSPDLSTPKEARIFLKKLSSILEYLKVFIPGELSMKSDVNVSIEGGERIEVKNVTGIIEVEKVIDCEIFRQGCLLDDKKKIERETRAWLPESKTIVLLRKKESEEDYGYIFEPDLTKIEVSKEWIQKIQKTLPELAHQKIERYQKQYGISQELAFSMASDLDIAIFYEKCIIKQDPKFAATWIDLLKKTLYYNDLSIKETKLTTEIFLKLLDLVKSEKVTKSGAEMILRDIIHSPEKFEDIIKNYSIIDNAEQIVSDVISEESKAVSEYISGNQKALQFLMGQVIKKSNRRIDAITAKSMLEKKLK